MEHDHRTQTRSCSEVSLCARLIATLVSALAASPCAAQEDQTDEARAFQIYDTQAVSGLVQSALEHIDAERWQECLVDLQTLLVEHRGEVLPPSHPSPDRSNQTSLYEVHMGASEWAARTLMSLPAEAQALYRDRHGLSAQRALDAAISAADRGALARVARRWPITHAAARAWWALGDLEVELGNIEVGLGGWRRALQSATGRGPESSTDASGWRTELEFLAGADDIPDVDGMLARIEFAVAFLASGSDELILVRERPSGTALGGGGDYGKLGRARDSWAASHRLATSPTHPYKSYSRGRNSMYAARLGDTIYYSTSRSMHAIGAVSGEELWRTADGFLGWGDISREEALAFEEAIALREAMIAPCVAQGVVVAHLQIPRVFERKDSYGDLDIIKIVPERRLFAFEAESGRMLWNTQPPSLWNGESGSFSHRMSVVGPPTVSDSRLLVPCAMLRGRIELHLGCYDLHSGELLWSTPLITGQRPLNMFGRLIGEFTCPPPLVEGDRVVVQTQLGTICSLDLFTGEVVWESLYDQILFTPGTYYTEGNLPSVWRNTPPVITDGVVICTPMDSKHMLGLDLTTGASLWNISQEELNRKMGLQTRSIDCLLGALDPFVFVSGLQVAAFEAPGGLARGAPTMREWAFPATDRLSRYLPRPVITSDRIYVPDQRSVHVLERHSGRQVNMIETQERPGNLLVSEGMLFSLSPFSLNAYFEWDAMLRKARARVLAHPGDAEAHGALARLLYKRGLSAMRQNEYKTAARFLKEARVDLEPMVGTDWHSAPENLVLSLHQVLRAEARNLRLMANPRAARQLLLRARPMGTTRRMRCETLLEEQAVVRGREMGAWLDVLQILERDYGDLRVDVFAPDQAGQQDVWKGRLMPADSSLVDVDDRPLGLDIPVGLWVTMERSQALALIDTDRNREAEFVDLHRILRDYRTEFLPVGTAWSWAADRIAARLARADRVGYGRFEDQAERLLERAQTKGNQALLEDIPVLFPFSRAAGISNDVRIDLAVGRGDAAGVADIVLSELPDQWNPVDASERQIRHLLALGNALADKGNLVLRTALVKSLARYHPDFVPDLEGLPPRRMTELASNPPWSAASPLDPVRPKPSFTSKVTRIDRPRHRSSSTLVPVGTVPPGVGQEGTVQLHCDGMRLYAISDQSVPEEAWIEFFDPPTSRGRDSLPPEFSQAIATSPGRVHISTISRVVSLDRDSKEELWSWDSGGQGLIAVNSQSGVLVVQENFSGGSERPLHRLIGLDAGSGVVLWEFHFHRDEFHARPVIGEFDLALVPASGGRGLLFDLITGRNTGEYSLSFSMSHTAASAWIEDGKLILPNYTRGRRPEQNHVLAIDVSSGEVQWRLPFSGAGSDERELMGIVSHAERHFLHLLPVLGSPRDSRRPGLFELNTKLGALASRPLIEFKEDDVIVGIPTRTRTELETPLLFSMSTPSKQGERVALRCVHLRYGMRWKTMLPETVTRLAASVPMPAVSDTTIALAYKQPVGTPGSSGRRSELLFLDRSNGQIMNRQPLESDMWRSSESALHLSALGDALLVAGARRMEIMK